ncbi:putative transporter [Myxozyma melibiosi]|uniref:Transporter n=1 Tax=Myxozyma melibiosi TaxID=54550 RepID=A0ABR1FDA9_9ASCO
MGSKESIRKGTVWTRSPFYRYMCAIRRSPPMIYNRHLFLCVFVFACTGMPKGWDEGSCASITKLGSFTSEFGIDTDKDSGTISNIVSFVNLAAGVGAILSMFLNDRYGRIWCLRLYMVIYLTGCLASTFAYGNIGALYFGRLWAGLGIGAASVIGPTYIVEVAPKATRGLMTLWFNLWMLLSQMIGVFVVYGVKVHISPKKTIQYQIPFFVQVFVPCICIGLSFLVTESPRWLALCGRYEESADALCKIRKLPRQHPVLEAEFNEIRGQIEQDFDSYGRLSLKNQMVEIVTIPTNLRRLQLSFMAYFLAQWSGANGITNYLPTIFGLIGVEGDEKTIYSTGLYAFTKLMTTLIASLFFTDAVGRRKSLLIGVLIQMCCHYYLGGYLKYYLADPTGMPTGASRAAIGAIFIHAFGWSIGLYSLPYIFGSELYPSRVRALGGALSQGFHWLFYFAITKATPGLFNGMNVWGTFIFWGTWCAISWVYGFFMVPETSGRSLESMNSLFQYKWYELRRHAYPEPEDLAEYPYDVDYTTMQLNDTEAGSKLSENNHHVGEKGESESSADGLLQR